MVTQRCSQNLFYGTLALFFVAGAWATTAVCKSMANMADMSMPGGWTMSGVWMLMPDQTLIGAAGSFVGMWAVMMAPMMLPSLAPMLVRYRNAVDGRGANLLGLLTAIVGSGYFLVWTVIGLGVFAIGFPLSAVLMRHSDLSRAVPVSMGLIVIMVGALQSTQWKARRLNCCREMPKRESLLPPNAVTAWRHGVRIGLDCTCCCFELMTILILLGVMDLRLMAVVSAAVSAERLAPNGDVVARVIGWVTVGGGFWLIGRGIGVW